MANMMMTAEKALHKKTNKMLAVATKRYKKLMRQAKKAANAHKREQYVAAALGALLIEGHELRQVVRRDRPPIGAACDAGDDLLGQAQVTGWV